MSQSEPVSVRILDREYTVGVGAEERESLTAAARLLDAKMREIRGSNRMAAVDPSPCSPRSIWPTNCSSCAMNTRNRLPPCSRPSPT